MPKLNFKQDSAANKLEGNLLIIASAGTGKTTTIVERYINLLKSGVKPDEILMTTFTNKAAKDMIKKIEKETDFISNYIGTMHSLFLKILRNNSLQAFGDKEYTLITEESDKRKIVKEILEEAKMESKAEEVRYFVRWISKFKNRGIFARDLSWEGGIDEAKKEGIISELVDDEVFYIDLAWRGKVNFIYKKYQEYLHRHKLMDFDEIMLLTYDLFKNNPNILKKYKNKFKAIMVDEAQDLNIIQINILELLSNNNLCLIGDDCQNIYEWRGTSNDLVFKFRKNEKTIYLEDNYRSTENIISSINKVIDSMEFKIDKKLVSTREPLRSIQIESHESSEEELNFVIDKIKNMLDNGEKAGDIVVLFRTNLIGKRTEREFRRRMIPCHLAKNVDFFSREEIKDILSFLRLKVNPYSKIDFLRIISLVKGLGKVKQQKIIDFSFEKNISFIESLKLYPIKNFGIVIEEQIKKLLKTFEEKNILEGFLNGFNYLVYLEEKYRESNKLNDKLENIHVLEELFKTHNGNINSFLDSLIDIEKKEKSEEKVTLSTIHGAKGLEWKTVFLISANEGILPFYKEELTKAKRDSELRLFYVAISRAKDDLIISYSRFSGYKRMAPSQFILIILDDEDFGFKTF